MQPIRESTARFLRNHWLVPAFLLLTVLLAMIPGNLERFFVYFPTRDIPADPASLGMSFQDLAIQTEDGVRLHGWFVPHTEALCTFLIFHGNAGNIGHRVPWIELLHRLRAHVLIIDYRGYGRSEGRPFEKGLYRDARAAYAWWQAHRPGRGSRLVVIGESLGGAVAVDLASRAEIDGLILQSTFTSAWDMAKTVMPLGLLQPLAGIRFQTEAKIRSVTCPKLFIHGDRDNIVPYRLGRKLFEAARPPKHFYDVPGAGHNDLLWVAGPGYAARISEFVAALAATAHRQPE